MVDNSVISIETYFLLVLFKKIVKVLMSFGEPLTYISIPEIIFPCGEIIQNTKLYTPVIRLIISIRTNLIKKLNSSCGQVLLLAYCNKITKTWDRYTTFHCQCGSEIYTLVDKRLSDFVVLHLL